MAAIPHIRTRFRRRVLADALALAALIGLIAPLLTVIALGFWWGH